jgi:hypothetical protein
MPAEGMVDALLRAGRLVTRTGRVIDIHPTPEPSRVEIGIGSDVIRIGDLNACDAVVRHRAADAAVVSVVAQRLLVLERTCEFSFRSYGDSVQELAEYVARKFTRTRIAPATVLRAERELRAHPTSTVWVHEQVRMNKLRPNP